MFELQTLTRITSKVSRVPVGEGDREAVLAVVGRHAHHGQHVGEHLHLEIEVEVIDTGRLLVQMLLQPTRALARGGAQHHPALVPHAEHRATLAAQVALAHYVR